MDSSNSRRHAKNKKRPKVPNYNSFIFNTTARNVPRLTPPPMTTVMFNKSYPVWKDGDKILYAPLYSMPSNPYLAEPVAYIGKRRFKPRYSVEEINACKNITFKDYHMVSSSYTILSDRSKIGFGNHLAKLGQYWNNHELYLDLLWKTKSTFLPGGEYLHLYDISELGSYCLKQEIYKRISTPMLKNS